MNKKNSTTPVFDQSAQALNYELPDAKIAKYPLAERDASKLLVWQNGTIQDANFGTIAEFLPEESLLVFNNTKVIRARLPFQKTTGAQIEIFCLDPHTPADYQLAFQQTKSCSWNCMVGNLKKWKQEPLQRQIPIDGKEVMLTAKKISQSEGNVLVQFSWDDESVDFSSLIEACGILPIPPYLHRETESSDLERYQTIYSKVKGSVAAPTAGLHFTDQVFQTFQQKNITTAEVTLHVGAGTFKPVKAATIADHEMHAEQFLVTRELLVRLQKQRNPIIAVGTTSIRTLESLYWLGTSFIDNEDQAPDSLHISQWQPYQNTTEASKTQALQALIDFMDKHSINHLTASTQIIIVPGYNFRVVDGMITNFHQPQSTLLLLIAAYLGDDWKQIYQHALDNNYRFLSYGDSNLYLK
ncbi:S-adenosylmethionine:tRNA ribosyltransferase-isomerase [Sunxiuqinia elliptica]|uniref:S-adenosylmethionine:tRNA ribosyltransferase-isomerase n=1 Tax=Sunxiuqinia elliptica TaxID=655355 RepID=A0A4R6GWA5_9BACT|nr:S-adenosylmethionine:tRNA ribosyltransferase-isomerase [Sunxiuqinia elliptica]TDN99035.1 S-adenosylmethionine:tRNA ribosyltransferase-isomerase [Sunxiuqinia elliptica]TDO56475.1 S-adenosylmethionine:tRNA ribosyltransferase-isomerase [Sunxiuqinia elliptica]